MGGGTILIPILTILLGVNQHTAQAINLISFIPMAIISLIIHLKKGYVKIQGILLIVIPGLLSCFGASYLAKHISGKILQKSFGAFLILLSVYQFFSLSKINGKEQKFLKNKQFR